MANKKSSKKSSTKKKVTKKKVSKETQSSGTAWLPITEANKKYINDNYKSMGLEVLSQHTGLSIEQINDFVLNVDRDNPNVRKQLHGPVKTGLTHKNATVMTQGHAMKGDQVTKDAANSTPPMEGVFPVIMKGENQKY